MQSSVSIPTIQKCVDIIGEKEGVTLHNLMTRSEFRSADTLIKQINFLKEKSTDLTVRAIIKILGISNDAYYKAIRSEPVSKISSITPPTRFLFIIEEEAEIIRMIFDRQINNDCWSSKGIRDYASYLFKAKTGVERSFCRDWFYDFKMRHKEEIMKVKADCIDDLRAEISIDEVERYFAEIDEMLQDPPIKEKEKQFMFHKNAMPSLSGVNKVIFTTYLWFWQ